MVLRTLSVIIAVASIAFGYWYFSTSVSSIDDNNNSNNNYDNQIPPSRCEPSYKSPINHLSTKTPYLYDYKDESKFDYTVEGCTPLQIWLAIRHGSRTPGLKQMNIMRQNLSKLRDKILENNENQRGKLCMEDIRAFKNWKISPLLLDDSKQKNLVPQGGVEMEKMAKRFKDRLPNLFDENFSNDTFKFKYTKTQRAEASAKFFANSLFGPEDSKNVWFPKPRGADPILRFYKGCQKWKQEVDENPEAYAEKVKFENTKVFLNLIKNVEKRLGFQEPLNLEKIDSMYLACSYELAFNPSENSPWCSAFDKTDFEVLEYRQDLEYYWIDGYGYEISYKVACPTINDFIQHFKKKLESSDENPKVISYFTHSGTLLKVISRLGLFKDKGKLTSDTFQHFIKARKWRMSSINKFASNLGFILYNCTSEPKVGFIFHEKPFGLPACSGSWICSFNELKAYFTDITQNCDVPAMCKV